MKRAIRYHSVLHNTYLEQLVYRLDEIGEDGRTAKWIMRDGILLKDGEDQRKKFCDLIIVYETHAVPVELKGSSAKYCHALQQLRNGKLFIEQELELAVPYGKFVVYHENTYKTQIIGEEL